MFERVEIDIIDGSKLHYHAGMNHANLGLA